MINTYFFPFIPRRIDGRSSKCWRILSQLFGEIMPFRPFASVCVVVLYGTSFSMFKLLMNVSEKVKAGFYTFQSFASDVHSL